MTGLLISVNMPHSILCTSSPAGNYATHTKHISWQRLHGHDYILDPCLDVVHFFHFTLTTHGNCRTDHNSALPSVVTTVVQLLTTKYFMYSPEIMISSLFPEYKDCPQIVLEKTQPKQAPILHVNFNVQNSHINLRTPTTTL